MLYLALEHARRTSFCPLTSEQHGAAQSRWAAMIDGSQITDAVAERDYPELATLLVELRNLPGDPADVAIVVDPNFTEGACTIDPIGGQDCWTRPSQRRLEISVRVPFRDGSPSIRTFCPRCLSKHFPEIDAILHKFCGTELPAEPRPEPKPEKTPEQIRRECEHELTLKVARAMNGEGPTGSRITKFDSALALIAAWRELADIDRQQN